MLGWCTALCVVSAACGERGGGERPGGSALRWQRDAGLRSVDGGALGVGSTALEHRWCNAREAVCGDPVARGEAEARSDIVRGKRYYMWLGELPPVAIQERFERRYRVSLEFVGCDMGSWDARKAGAYNRVVERELGIGPP